MQKCHEETPPLVPESICWLSPFPLIATIFSFLPLDWASCAVKLQLLTGSAAKSGIEHFLSSHGQSLAGFFRIFFPLSPTSSRDLSQKNKWLDCQLEWPHEKTWEDNEISWTSMTKVLPKVQCARSGKKMYKFLASKTAKSSMNTRNASVPEVLLV